MVKKVDLFVTSDGKEFKDEGSANAHEKGLEKAEKIEGYIAAAGLQKAQAGLMRKHIAAYLSFEETGQVPARAAEEAEEAGAADESSSA